jgi:hypothetical protein
VVLRLRRRLDRDVEVPAKLALTGSAASFDDVGRDRIRGPLQLSFHRDLSAARRTAKDSIDVESEGVRALPHEKLLKVLHATILHQLTTSYTTIPPHPVPAGCKL